MAGRPRASGTCGLAANRMANRTATRIARHTGLRPKDLQQAKAAIALLAASRGFRAGAAQCAEFIIGPAKGRTRWLIAPYGPQPAVLPPSAVSICPVMN